MQKCSKIPLNAQKFSEIVVKIVVKNLSFFVLCHLWQNKSAEFICFDFCFSCKNCINIFALLGHYFIYPSTHYLFYIVPENLSIASLKALSDIFARSAASFMLNIPSLTSPISVVSTPSSLSLCPC